MKRSVIVDVTARLILPSALLFALHLLLVGHDRPGGGFVGGLVAVTLFDDLASELAQRSSF